MMVADHLYKFLEDTDYPDPFQLAFEPDFLHQKHFGHCARKFCEKDWKNRVSVRSPEYFCNPW